MQNVDPNELSKFEKLASRWWDQNSEFRPLHEINPLRLNYIEEQVCLQNKKVIDIGCGGGILSESMWERGASVTGVDAGQGPISVARLHARERSASIDYRQGT
ncbi:MAG: bifunctional 2-polyprenyl-6-hydroxyphenol methylase/3-demethylubiquinol 3-O-methyltransferase UbiG, partial [Arenicellales bacterium]|nr:bifunctional 2-polyprenyl-6-hydroxyphenol methylase/3-demethylubiquinol 3-O-methyltransferase UbiG [Arenicellales bacterium]